MDQGKYVVAEKRNRAMNHDEGGIYALQSLEHHLEPGGPDPLGGALVDTVPTAPSSWWVSKERRLYAWSAIQLTITIDTGRNCS